MFDSIELPVELVSLFNSPTPLLGIVGTIERHRLIVITNYFHIGKQDLLLEIPNLSPPNVFTINVLRKGEDHILMKAHANEQIEEQKLKIVEPHSVPFYLHSVLSFVLKYKETLKTTENSSLCIYESLIAWGVAGLDPTFNDDVTLAKSLEVMAMTYVDKLVVDRKINQ
ncbi:MAG: hypothetical protein ACTSYD_04295 [Candidatus Heimdallarchaeaceae archaeon]